MMCTLLLSRNFAIYVSVSLIYALILNGLPAALLFCNVLHVLTRATCASRAHGWCRKGGGGLIPRRQTFI
ncbi:hypothetical protein SPHINGO391_110003 [Sphingomonas aurantiaca]|uniref:Uncharacterized protein n=1 Tax=Sphingomonas aurantiaca TaxID=185949 RepID=A0A5E7XQ41_9SPHN|nr:hypothetical protein SPHINGO391_110003 [Sphingomonas aurantiaca]